MTAAAWRLKLPNHDYAARHVLLRAARQPDPKTILRLVKALEPGAKVARDSVREYAWDLGAKHGHRYGWIAKVARELDINYHTLYSIVTSKVGAISSKTVDQVSKKSRVKRGVFYDAEI